MKPTDRDCALVANLAAERARLGEADGMGFGRRAAANHAGLRRDELAMFLVEQANTLAATRRCRVFASRAIGAGVVAAKNGSASDGEAACPIASSGNRSALGECPSVPSDASLIANFSRKLASTRLASETVKVFLAGRFLWTHSAAASSDWRRLRSAIS